MQRQNLAAQDGVEDPIRQADLNLRHALGFGIPDHLPAVDQAETLLDGLLIRPYVGFNAGAAQAVERGLQLFVAAAVGVAVRRHQQIVGFQVQRFMQLGASIQFRQKLTDAVDQNVLVVNRGQPEDARRDRDFHAVMFVFLDAAVGLGREREDRMLHRAHVVLGNRVRNVADEEILDRMAIRKKRGAGQGWVFLGHPRIVLSHMGSVLSCFHT